MGTLNKRKAARGGAAHDVEAVLDELYTTPPSDFVARREALAAAAKAAGHVEDARRIRAARRPTLAAWAANLLLRNQLEESQRFLELGRALREAYRTLDATEIHELSDQRRRIVSTLSREAAQLARAAGHRLSDTAQQDVESTLRAVLADPEAADRWAGGRLEGALSPPSDFPTDTTPAAGAPPRPTSTPATTPPPSTPSTRTRTRDELAERRRQRHKQLEQARTAANEAEQRLRDKRREQADAEVALQRARDRYEHALQQVSAAEQRLQQAREQLQRADHEQQEAEARDRATADAAAQAERAAREAAQKVKRLSARST